MSPSAGSVGRRVRSAGVVAGLVLALAACGSQAADSPGGTGGASQATPGRSAAHDTNARATTSGLPPCPGGRDAAPVDGGLPDVTLDCLGPGPGVTLSQLRGTPMVVNVWASWCPPCAQEMPYVESVRRHTHGSVRFLGIDLLDRSGSALAAVKRLGMHFPSVQDPDGSVRSSLKVPGPPVTLLVDAQGRVVHRHVGQLSSAAELRGLVHRYLGVTA